MLAATKKTVIKSKNPYKYVCSIILSHQRAADIICYIFETQVRYT